MNRGQVAMRPMHRYFQGAVAEFAGQVKEFHVEAEALDPLAGKQYPGGLPPEKLEAALRVSKIDARDAAGEEIEHPAGRFPKRRLADGDPLGLQRPRAQDHIVPALQRLPR